MVRCVVPQDIRRGALHFLRKFVEVPRGSAGHRSGSPEKEPAMAWQRSFRVLVPVAMVGEGSPCRHELANLFPAAARNRRRKTRFQRNQEFASLVQTAPWLAPRKQVFEHVGGVPGPQAPVVALHVSAPLQKTLSLQNC